MCDTDDHDWCMINYQFTCPVESNGFTGPQTFGHTPAPDRSPPPPPPPPSCERPARPTRASAKRQTTRRRGWKCNAEYLLANMTKKERKALADRGVAVPAAADAPLSATAEKNIRSVLRKVRNVQSAQKTRQDQKKYRAALEKKCEAAEKANRKLTANVARLETLNRSLRQQIALAHPPSAPAGVPGVDGGRGRRRRVRE